MKHFLFIFISCILFIITPISGKAKVNLGLENYIQRTVDQASIAASPWQELEFGKARLVADQIGLKDIQTLILGLEVELNENWTLKQPDFEIADPELNLLVYPNLRIEKNIEGDWNSDFQGNLLFPFFLKGPFTKDLNLLLQSQLRACHPELGCRTQITLHKLSLPLSQSGASLWFGGLNTHLRQVGFPAKDVGIDFQTELVATDRIHLRLTFPQKISAVEIQGQEPLDIESPSIKENAFDCFLKTEYPLHEGDVIPILIRSSIGCFTLDLVIQNTPLSPLPDRLPFGVAFWSGLLFFLLSPAWCYWFNPLSLGQNDFRKGVRQIQILCLIGLFLLGVAWTLDILNTWYQCPIIQILTGILLIVLFIKPYARWYFLPLLFLILPKPFWIYLNGISGMAKIGMLVWWSICICLPFNIWILLQKHILKFFQITQSDLSYQLCIRLPYIILMGWTILSLMGFFK